MKVYVSSCSFKNIKIAAEFVSFYLSILVCVCKQNEKRCKEKELSLGRKMSPNIKEDKNKNKIN